MKIISIKRHMNFQIKLFGHNLLTYYNMFLLSFDTSNVKNTNVLKKAPITEENLAQCANDVFSLYILSDLFKQKDLVKGYMFMDDHSEMVGYMWIVYKGANDWEYRVRKADAIISNVYVNNNFRGKGYCGMMLNELFSILREQGIKKTYLICRKNNQSALKAYYKAGAQKEKAMHFFRILKCRIPYPKI